MTHEFGIFSLGDWFPEADGRSRGEQASQRLREIIDYGVLADRLGLDVFGVGERYRPNWLVTSPVTVLTAVAAQTGRIRLTSAIALLSVDDPIRLYEDFATLDLISQGRAELGVGRGSKLELDYFGVTDTTELDAEIQANYDKLVQAAARGQPVRRRLSGQKPDQPGEQLQPPPYGASLPLWLGSRSTESQARLGLPISFPFLFGHLPEARFEAWIKDYRDWGRHYGTSEQLKVALYSHIYIAETEAEALDAYRYYYQYEKNIDQDLPFETYRARATDSGEAFIGTAAQVTAKLRRLLAENEIDRFLGQVDWGGLPRARVEASIRRFATEVVPQLRG